MPSEPRLHSYDFTLAEIDDAAEVVWQWTRHWWNPISLKKAPRRRGWCRLVAYGVLAAGQRSRLHSGGASLISKNDNGCELTSKPRQPQFADYWGR